MNRSLSIIVCVMILLAAVTVSSIEGEVPHFTDEHLKDYKESHQMKSDERKKTRVKLPEAAPETKPLKRYEVPYKAYEGIAKRIIIPVTLNGNVTVPMLLDTGAPGVIISSKVAEKLKIFDSDEGRLLWMSGGIGGTVQSTFTILDSIEVGGAKDHFIPTEIIERSISEQFEGLIGMDFMANYTIHIDTSKHVLVFEQRPPRHSMPAGHDESWWRANFKKLSIMRAYWAKVKDDLDKQNDSSEKGRALKKVADQQYNEADKLFNKLDGYASRNAVPMHWRQY